MSKPDTARYYCERAGEYEEIYYRDDPGRRAELSAQVERLQQMARGRTVLDIACGTGYWLEPMSRTADSITAADLSMEMLRQSRAKPYSCPVDLVRCDLCALPLAEHRFDLVTLGFWFSHHPRQDYGALFGEIHRLLARDGRVWMIDNNPPAEGNARRLAGQDQFGNQLIRRWLSNGREFVILKNYFTEQQLRQVLEPQFELMSITHQRFYWAVELCLRSA